MDRVVIVGASASGLIVAESLRKNGFEGGLTIIGDEPHQPYDRPPLSKQVLSGQWDADRISLSKPASLAALEAQWMLGARATGLDTDQRLVTLADGQTVQWDRLVIATGVRPRTLPGASVLHGVHLLRTLDDALAMRSELAPGRRLVVVGGGFLGAEVAAVASRLHVDVAIVDPLPGLLRSRLGQVISDLLIELHTRNNVRLFLGGGVAEIEHEGGRATGVRLENGTVLAADVVLVSIGCTPNTEWLADSGVPVSNGVDCDESGMAVPGIFAVGDVANWWNPALDRRVRVEHRMNATDQALAVARAIVGTETGPPAVPYFWTDQFDVRVQVYGVPDATSRFELLDGELDVNGRFSAGYFDESGRLVAGLAWNMPKAARELRERVRAVSLRSAELA